MNEINQIELTAGADEVEDILGDIVSELRCAEAKFPIWPGDPVHGAALVVEESGELVKAALDWCYAKGAQHDVEIEAIQVAATAVRFLIFMNRVIEAEESGNE